MMKSQPRTVAAWSAILLSACVAIPLAPAATPPATTPANKPPLSPEELEQLVAPIALYPDSLMTQVLMASTYPLEVVEADRFAKAHKDIKGDALATELEKQTWDPSVRSLVNFPTVLDMMNQKLDSTVKLGDAFIADQKRVLDAVQKLRAKAQSQGNLKSTEQQKVTVQQQAASQVIVIEPAQPSVIYVPTYDPVVVYGAWPYPAYPPYYYHPPGYVAGAVVGGAIGFGVGVACGAAWGYAWGHCDWGHNDIHINVNQNNTFNTHIDRNKFQTQINNTNNRLGGGGGGTQWQHDPAHREGVAYRDNATAQKFGGVTANQAAQARDSFRGRADAGRQDIARGGASEFRGSGGSGAQLPNRGNPGGGLGAGGSGTQLPNRGNAGGGLGGGGSGTQLPSRGNLGGGGSGTQSPARSSGGGGAFQGLGGGGRAAGAASSRGAASRTGSFGGGARLGGGGGLRRR